MKLKAQAWMTVLLCIAAAVGQTAASAGTFAGSNGRIAFSSGDVEVIAPDGTGRVNLTGSFADEQQPAWNATATKLVFRDSGSSLRTMNANGSDSAPLVSMGSFVGNPTWSRDGSVVAFDHYIGGSEQENRIYVVPAAGGTATVLVDLDAQDPSYSPDGTKIAFEESAGESDIGVMNADGTGVVLITSGSGGNNADFDPSWSPDGTKIAFTRAKQIWTMNADGSGAIQLTTGADAAYPTWSPDGTKIAFERDADIWVMASGGGTATNITSTIAIEERAPDWGICTGSGCPPQVNAPVDRFLPENEDGDLRVVLRVSLSARSMQDVSVQFAYRDGTATLANGDYRAAALSGTVTIPAGQLSSGDLPYSFILFDDVGEPDETYTLDLLGATNATIADPQTVITILGEGSTDARCPGLETVPGIHIIGTGGDDVLEGTDVVDVICGLGGNDRILGGLGSDTLVGGDGNDRLEGGSGNDTLDGGPGDDLLTDDAVFGDQGNDTMNGGKGNDSIHGGDDNDDLDGGEGDDRLYGGRGSDTLDGGDGSDRLSGTNTNSALIESDKLGGGAGDDVLFSGGGAGDHARLYGENGNDRLVGGGGDDKLYGGFGNDHVEGLVGDDLLDGSRGADVLEGAAGKDVLTGGDDFDRLFGGLGNDLLNGGAAPDLCDGGGGSDQFVSCGFHLR